MNCIILLTFTDVKKINSRQRAIQQIDKNGNVLEDYNSLIHANTLTGLYSSAILRVCQGKANHTGGKYFKFKDNMHFTSEDQLQAWIYKRFHNKLTDFRLQLFSVPNGGTRDIREATKLKATGLLAGVPDLIFYDKGVVIFFELKKPQAELSVKQQLFKQKANKNQTPYFLVRTPDQFFYGLIITLMSRRSITEETAMRFFAALKDEEGIVFFGLTELEFKYEVKVFEFLFGLAPGEEQDLEILTAEQTRETFKRCVKKFIELEFDVSNGFQITFSNDYRKFVKSIINE